LKSLGFLSPDGKPTALYHDYRDHSRSRAVMAQALKQSYGDVFLIKEHPTQADKNSIQGKFKSFHNVSDNVASLMTKTFMALLALADISATNPNSSLPKEKKQKETSPDETNKVEERIEVDPENQRKPMFHAPGLHYNIQIHLPATKDVKVYNAIFKSLKEHLFET
jgi:hypothetical protein